MFDSSYDTCLVKNLCELQWGPKPDLYVMTVDETCPFRQRIMRTFDPDWNNTYLRSQRQPSHATLERLDLAIPAARALRKDQDAIAILEKLLRTMQATETLTLKREGIQQHSNKRAFPPASKEVVSSSSNAQA